mmetsp:Transcript_13157/g.29657  ORF Transcript_13157/g.29657 Transcript_13157/m.29657 type:complete len:226 (+) Transcript_13157:74-751(+)
MVARSTIIVSLCLVLAIALPLAFVSPSVKTAQKTGVARGASSQDQIPSVASELPSPATSCLAAAAAVGAVFGLLKSKTSLSSKAKCCNCPCCANRNGCCGCCKPKGTGASLVGGFSAAAAAAVVGISSAANAMVDYSGLAYLGGSDKVDINNANVQAYRQFPGLYPTIAGLIGSHGPYKSVQDVYNVPGMTEPMKSVLKQYEGNLVCFPADPAYFIDRVNNGLYR